MIFIYSFSLCTFFLLKIPFIGIGMPYVALILLFKRFRSVIALVCLVLVLFIHHSAFATSSALSLIPVWVVGIYISTLIRSENFTIKPYVSYSIILISILALGFQYLNYYPSIFLAVRSSDSPMVSDLLPLFLDTGNNYKEFLFFCPDPNTSAFFFLFLSVVSKNFYKARHFICLLLYSLATGSRSFLLLTFAVYLTIWILENGSKIRLRAFRFFIVLLNIILYVYMFFYPFFAAFSYLENGTGVLNIRTIIWARYLNIFQDQGIRFFDASFDVASEMLSNGFTLQDPHNLYLDFYFHFGLFGLILFVLGLYFSSLQIQRRTMLGTFGFPVLFLILLISGMSLSLVTTVFPGIVYGSLFYKDSHVLKSLKLP